MSDLRQLLAAYFHQDWADEYGQSWEAAVDDYSRREPERIPGAIAENAALLDKNHSEHELRSPLLDLGNLRRPGDGPHAYREWLSEIRDRLAGSL